MGSVDSRPAWKSKTDTKGTIKEEEVSKKDRAKEYAANLKKRQVEVK
jgi:hypothetical protein